MGGYKTDGLAAKLSGGSVLLSVQT